MAGSYEEGQELGRYAGLRKIWGVDDRSEVELGVSEGQVREGDKWWDGMTGHQCSQGIRDLRCRLSYLSPEAVLWV